MKNLLLLSGMDGTGILFRPLLDELNQSDVNYRIAIYDSNACHIKDNNNQALEYQADKIVKFIHGNFGYESFVVVFESYSSLFVSYLLKCQLAIEKIYLIGGFLACPSVLAKFGLFINPAWARLLPNQLLGFLLFRHWANEELIGLFREVLAVISSPAILPLFKSVYPISLMPKSQAIYQNHQSLAYMYRQGVMIWLIKKQDWHLGRCLRILTF
ncbi:hypothetical protein [Moraxella bovis]|uniref:Alpha/beta hydrolase n=1 Tax=Moraxella bovis TaxID=476 RepID=A0A378PYF6_MORBO|nr:hypothetical protein [Moraxella bovis]STY93502.1 Uncharacterised protein [Moraxella bovis]